MKYIYAYLIVLLVFVSCSSTKQALKPKDLKNLESRSILDSLYSYYGNYETFYASFSAEIYTKQNDSDEKNDKKTEIKGSIRVKKDSVIWISIKPLMVEAVRVQITPDSVFFINKVEKTYYAGNYDLLNQIVGFEINFSTFQSILLDEMCLYPFTECTDTLAEFSEFDYKKKNNLAVFEGKVKRKNKVNGEKLVYAQSFGISTDFFRIAAMQLNEQTKNYEINLEYADFEEVDKIIFPEDVTFIIKSKSGKLKLNLEYSKIEFNKQLTYPFIISSRYKKWER